MYCSMRLSDDDYRRSRNSSSLRPHCLRMSERVPFANSECMGTTVLKTCSPTFFSRDTWLPFCRNSTKPPRLRARMARSPEMLGNLGISVRNFDGRPERWAFGWPLFRDAPGFEVQRDGFSKVRAGSFDIFALRGNVQLWATGDVPRVFLGDEHREAISHIRIVAEVG